MCLGQADLAGVLAAAAGQLQLAAVLEVAVVRHVDRVGHLAGDGVELVDLTAHDLSLIHISAPTRRS